jgi:Flp pilus assembly pilin Flp
MDTLLNGLLNDEQGQDLIEYTLLMAFVALASAALFIGSGGSIKGIWAPRIRSSRRPTRRPVRPWESERSRGIAKAITPP